MNSDVIILGGGLVGATLALALDAHGVTSIVVDPADPAVVHAPGFDGRASALAIGCGDPAMSMIDRRVWASPQRPSVKMPIPSGPRW